MNELLAIRQQARDEKDWVRSDEIRDVLGEVGLVIEDSSDGVRWHRR